MNNRHLTMLTDLYELTMMDGYLCEGIGEKTAVFDIYFRKQNESNYCIACGLEQAVQYINSLKFSEEDIEYLKSLNLFSKRFIEYLADFKFSGDVFAVPEGTVVFPNEPMMIIKGNIIEAQLMESALLNIINHQTLIASKASRMNFVAQGAQLAEFGLRRAQGPDAGVYGARAAYIGGCDCTSNVLAAQKFGIPLKGTHAHAWVMSFGSELEAFRAYAKAYPDNCLLLVDTYDTLRSGVPNAIKVFKELSKQGHKPVGVRLDSGDLAYLSKKARQMLDDAGFSDARIFVSGDLDEYAIVSLKAQGAKIDAYGVGTKLITSHSNPSLGGVYKLAALEENGVLAPKIKISDNPEKITVPSFKNVYRLSDNQTNMAIADLITLHDEVIDTQQPLTIYHPIETWKRLVLTNFKAKSLLTQIFKNGKQVYQLPDLHTVRQHKNASLGEFWDEYKRIDRPQLYKVDLSDKLYKLQQKMLTEPK